MKILFLTTEHPAALHGGLGTFTREFVSHLKRVDDIAVKVVYFHFDTSSEIPQEPAEAQGLERIVDHVLLPDMAFPAHSTEARLLENAASLQSQLRPLLEEFRPDIIHCNDRLTYLPVRYEKNVVYSSHLLFTDLLGTQSLEDVYLQELKIERLALVKPAASVVYSQFAQRRALQGIAAESRPVLLPLGFNPKSYSHNQKPKGRIEVAYFGRFENLQKGTFDFIRAIESLGAKWQEEHKVTVSLYGKGELPKTIDKSLFQRICFLEGPELRAAYAQTHVVVMPSRYEPFGLVGLEAMASGCVLLATPGLGMDEYAQPGVCSVPLKPGASGIAKVLNEVISDWKHFKDLGKKAKASVQVWTWERAIHAHVSLYKSILRDGGQAIKSAHHPAYLELEKYAPQEPSDVPMIHHLLNALETETSTGLVIHPIKNFQPQLKTGWKALSLWVPHQEIGIIPKLEFLPFDDESVDQILVAGAWEVQTNPLQSLRELLRCARKTIKIVYYLGNRRHWHSIAMESPDDWNPLIASFSSSVEVNSNKSLGTEPWYQIEITKVNHKK